MPKAIQPVTSLEAQTVEDDKVMTPNSQFSDAVYQAALRQLKEERPLQAVTWAHTNSRSFPEASGPYYGYRESSEPFPGWADPFAPPAAPPPAPEDR